LFGQQGTLALQANLQAFYDSQPDRVPSDGQRHPTPLSPPKPDLTETRRAATALETAGTAYLNSIDPRDTAKREAAIAAAGAYGQPTQKLVKDYFEAREAGDSGTAASDLHKLFHSDGYLGLPLRRAIHDAHSDEKVINVSSNPTPGAVVAMADVSEGPASPGATPSVSGKPVGGKVV
jgi:hypothetical protein